MMPFAEQFTLMTRNVVSQDADGNDVYDETETPLTGAFAPAGSSENVQGQQQVITRDTLYLDEGQCLPGPQDKILVRGCIRDVDATPGEFLSPFTGWAPGPVVKLKTVTG